jgi:hypothetical protein
MKFTRILTLCFTLAISCGAYAQQSKNPRPHSRTIEGTVIGDVGGNAHWQWIEIESGGKQYRVGIQYNDGQYANPRVIGGDCCLNGTRVRVTYIGKEYDMLKATRIVILSSRSTAEPPSVSAQSRRTQNAELNIGTIDNSDIFDGVVDWCFFKSPSASERSKSYIFFVDLDETPYKFWLNIDGRVTALKFISSTRKNLRRLKKGSSYTERYRSGDITAHITYVIVKKYPEGEAFTATVVVTKGNRSKTVKTVGECG